MFSQNATNQTDLDHHAELMASIEIPGYTPIETVPPLFWSSWVKRYINLPLANFQIVNNLWFRDL